MMHRKSRSLRVSSRYVLILTDLRCRCFMFYMAGPACTRVGRGQEKNILAWRLQTFKGWPNDPICCARHNDNTCRRKLALFATYVIILKLTFDRPAIPSDFLVFIYMIVSLIENLSFVLMGLTFKWIKCYVFKCWHSFLQLTGRFVAAWVRYPGKNVLLSHKKQPNVIR